MLILIWTHMVKIHLQTIAQRRKENEKINEKNSLKQKMKIRHEFFCNIGEWTFIKITNTELKKIEKYWQQRLSCLFEEYLCENTERLNIVQVLKFILVFKYRGLDIKKFLKKILIEIENLDIQVFLDMLQWGAVKQKKTQNKRKTNKATINKYCTVMKNKNQRTRYYTLFNISTRLCLRTIRKIQTRNLKHRNHRCILLKNVLTKELLQELDLTKRNVRYLIDIESLKEGNTIKFFSQFKLMISIIHALWNQQRDILKRHQKKN
ncbi:hypothetical protein RFI_13220 [Reticulomyxa filosa]|uniref:Uncharacterized protein n=1 Tax=Reticulomyxa filosa TaxID=46433 RepID=X6NDY2_RETFI|nr:hypothetical protein RFI_13220 [Reticulomyxa filosa]|eukprot:ETO23939.1 hypothetical protein RFI_13220 [Reticulomyxa filosa]